MKRIFVCLLVIIGLIGTAEAGRFRTSGYHQKSPNYKYYNQFNSKRSTFENPTRNSYSNLRIKPLAKPRIKPLAKPNYAKGVVQW